MQNQSVFIECITFLSHLRVTKETDKLHVKNTTELDIQFLIFLDMIIFSVNIMIYICDI